jgi:hypothetical protein
LYYEEDTLVVTDEVPRQQKPCTKPLRKSLMILRIFLSIPQFRNSWFALMSYLLKMPLESDSWAFGDSDFAYATYCRGIMVDTRSWRFDCIGSFQFWS